MNVKKFATNFIIIMIYVGTNTTSESDIFMEKQSVYYNDTCAYNDLKFKGCGDLCPQNFADCFCGKDTIDHVVANQFCCISSGDKCIMDGPWWMGGLVNCSQGMTIPMSSHCNNTVRSLQCYNSYQDSQYIGYYSHYTCSHTCVSVGEMCQGINWCGEYEECSSNL